VNKEAFFAAANGLTNNISEASNSTSLHKSTATLVHALTVTHSRALPYL